MYNRLLQLPLSGRQSIFLIGPLVTGKSTWIKKHMPNALYLDLLDYKIANPLRKRPHVLDKLIPDVSALGINMSSFVEAGLSIGLLVTAANLFKNVLGGILGAFLELGFVKDFLDKMGINVDSSKKGWEKFRDIVSKVWQKIQDKWGKVELTIGEEKLSIATWIRTIQTLWHQFKTNFTNANKDITESFGKINSAISKFFKTLDEEDAITVLNAFAFAISKVADAINDFSSAMDKIKEKGFIGAHPLLGEGGLGLGIKGGRQSGGFIPQTGLYRLHAGETVVPESQSISSNPVINIYSSGGMDESIIDRIKAELGVMIAQDLGRAARR